MLGGVPIPAVSSLAPGLAPGLTPGLAPSLFAGGLPMGKLPLQILTAFPATGYLGLNLSAAGMPIAAMAKAAIYAAGVALSFYATTLYIDRLYMKTASNMLFYFMTLAPPWYIFDCLQILFDSNFDSTGFNLPLPFEAIPSGGAKDGIWLLTFPVLTLILGAISAAGGAALLKYLPQSMVDAGGKYAQYATIGGGIGLAAIGLAAGMFMKSPEAATAPTVPTAPIAPIAPIAPTQGGGGSTLPPLSSFIKQFKQKTPPNESITFIGLLALIILGGGTLGYLRSKSGPL